MTYTVMAHCPNTGRVGIGIATYSLAVGLYCDGIKANVGVSITQAFVRQRNNRLAINLLEQGFEPETVITTLKQDDEEPSYRQIGVIDRFGKAAAYSGGDCRPWAGHVVGDGVISFGNGLVGQHVAQAIEDGYMSAPREELEERLIRGLEAGRDAGGQGNGTIHAPERSAAIVVFGRHDYPDTDLRVDLHDAAVDELRRIYTVYKPYQEYYRSRGIKPSTALPQEVFMASIGQATGFQTS